MGWDERFLGLAHYISNWSKDPSTRVGAVIVGNDKRVLAMGYNGFPRGIDDSPERYNDRETKYKYVVHAEPNAILNATGSIRNCTMYCTAIPCTGCAKLIIQAGIRRLVFPTTKDGTFIYNERWEADQRTAIDMMYEASMDIL